MNAHLTILPKDQKTQNSDQKMSIFLDDAAAQLTGYTKKSKQVEWLDGQRDRFVTDAELTNFCAFSERTNETGRMLSSVARLAYLTGQRRGDLLRLRLDLLTDEGIMITQSKTRAKVIIEWTPALRDCVFALKSLDRPVSGLFLICNRSGQPYTNSGFKAMWGRTMAAWIKEGNEGFTFHDLRAKAITRMVEDGRKAADLSGHATDAIVKKVYDRRAFKRSKAVE